MSLFKGFDFSFANNISSCMFCQILTDFNPPAVNSTFFDYLDGFDYFKLSWIVLVTFRKIKNFYG